MYRRYAGLFFCLCVDANDNELAYLEAIHFFVEVLDAFFGNVCELDLVFNFYKVLHFFPPIIIYHRHCTWPHMKDMKWSRLTGFLLLFLFQVYSILDEVFLAGEIEETSKNVVLTRLDHLDKL